MELQGRELGEHDMRRRLRQQPGRRRGDLLRGLCWVPGRTSPMGPDDGMLCGGSKAWTVLSALLMKCMQQNEWMTFTIKKNKTPIMNVISFVEYYSTPVPKKWSVI